MALEHESNSPLAIAIRRAGSQTAFAKLIGKRQSVVNYWLQVSKPLPAEHVLPIEAATGVSRHDLRPDIYPRETSSSAVATPAPCAAESDASTSPRRSVATPLGAPAP
ncbi:YdaS family helix-turn-helix protein [uncultured Croceicoccus sp.]|uniref:transcriptional regulator n=1 Tax=uncultured Croceicoccus sp. TaxID=1295329 RepID=UPI00260D995E|nr:YdaS family helix-turn-helix protein [uncultured Croceicoccus sp.]